jgi:FkbH-like protein
VRIDEPRLALQRFALSLRERGVLLCVVSRNEEADVLAVLDGRPEMLLRRAHLAGLRASWARKSESLRSLASELGLGLDAFVLLDDDAFVCAEVEEGAPGVVAVQLPEVPALLPGFLRGLWLLDRGRVTAEDRRRIDAYAEEAAREQARRTLSPAEFLETLALEVSVVPMEAADIGRVAQLTQRTNQFNATCVRRTEAEIAALPAGGAQVLVVRARDRFGDYGLVGVVVVRLLGATFDIDTFLLSCRVLGRGVEHAVVRDLAARAADCGASHLSLPFRPAPRNAPYATFFASLPADERSPVRATVPVELARTLAPVMLSGRDAATREVAAPAVASADRGADHRRIALESMDVASIRAALVRRCPQADDAIVPLGATHEAVLAACAEVLRIDWVPRRERLSALGADSLAVLRIVAAIRMRTGVALAFDDVLAKDPSPDDLAALVEMGGARAPWLDPPVRGDDPAGETTSLCQDVILAWERRRAPSRTWTESMRLELRGPLDASALREAARRVVDDEEVLRLVLRRDAAGACGLHDAGAIPFEVHEAPLDSQQLERFCAERGNAPFAMQGEPLVAFDLLRRGPDAHVLLVTHHQLVHDPTAFDVLGRAIVDRYAEVVGGTPSDPSSSPRYVDHARAERLFFAGEGAPLVAAARRRLEGVPPLDLRRPLVEPAGPAIDRGFRLDAAAAAAFQAVCRGCGVSPFTGFGALVALVLARAFDAGRVPYLVPVGLRGAHPELASRMGRFLNWIVVDFTLPRRGTLADVFAAARDAHLAAFAQQHVPAALVLGEDAFAHPLARVVLNAPLADPPPAPYRAGGLEATFAHPMPRSGARNALAFVLSGQCGELSFGVRGAAETFRAEEVDGFARALELAVRTLDVQAAI